MDRQGPGLPPVRRLPGGPPARRFHRVLRVLPEEAEMQALRVLLAPLQGLLRGRGGAAREGLQPSGEVLGALPARDGEQQGQARQIRPAALQRRVGAAADALREHGPQEPRRVLLGHQAVGIQRVHDDAQAEDRHNGSDVRPVRQQPWPVLLCEGWSAALEERRWLRRSPRGQRAGEAASPRAGKPLGPPERRRQARVVRHISRRQGCWHGSGLRAAGAAGVGRQRAARRRRNRWPVPGRQRSR
mmetsp:Transcript_19569/g.52365  ORF Transcript_19569/g.52365 Transcript_19569/m.52365 type:complete len:244 (-) Transcript_19569:682-1413(-)